MKKQTRQGAGGRRGSVLVEFGLAGTFIFLPLLTGTVTIGMSMLQSIQVAALNRDAGEMFAKGVDFTQTQNIDLLLKIAGSLNITAAGGNGVVVLSEIDGTGTNTAVCSRRIVVGNAALRGSSYVNPTGIDAGGNVTNVNEPSANADSFTPAVIPMSRGQVAYVAETYFSTSQYDWTGFLTGTGIYNVAVF
jgi:hypothetical protein